MHYDKKYNIKYGTFIAPNHKKFTSSTLTWKTDNIILLYFNQEKP